jgi:hypothetical protein
MLTSRQIFTIGVFALLAGCASGPERYAFTIDQMIPNEDGTVTLKAEGLSKYLREKAAYEAALSSFAAYAKPGEPGGPSGPPSPSPKPPKPVKPPYPKRPGPIHGPGPDKPGEVVIFDF